MFRRPGMRFAAAQALGPVEMAQLQNANRLMTAGQPEKAAPIFLQLARELQATQHPRKAANLHAQASHAFTDAKEETQALQQAQVTLRFFVRLQMLPRAAQFYGNIRNKMNHNGMSASATELEKEFGGVLAKVPARTLGGVQQGPHHLPTSCPKCGAPLRADEVEWVDAMTASCSFCGSVVAKE
jgi:hypothetical protein